jgi:hypothetical protein
MCSDPNISSQDCILHKNIQIELKAQFNVAQIFGSTYMRFSQKNILLFSPLYFSYMEITTTVVQLLNILDHLQ